MDFISLGGRDLIIVAVIVIATYLLVSLLRLSQLGRRARLPEPGAASSVDEELDDGDQASLDAADGRPFEPPATPASERDPGPGPLEHWPPLHQRREPRLAASAYAEAHEPAAAARSDFGQQLLRQQFEQELAQLRADMQAELDDLRTALAELQASQRVAPLYNEAMQLAQRGLPADVIADRCSISRGEAELVCALSRNQQDYPHHDKNHHDASGY